MIHFTRNLQLLFFWIGLLVILAISLLLTYLIGQWLHFLSGSANPNLSVQKAGLDMLTPTWGMTPIGARAS
jgi:hypothetical protein